MIKTCLAMVAVALTAGCMPRWHNGDTLMTHRLNHAVVCGDSLCLQGAIRPTQAVTDYGFRVNSVTDDAGTALRFKSYQMFWMKKLFFEAEFDAPDPGATAVTVDVEFISRPNSRRQRVQAVLPIERDDRHGFHNQSRRWERPLSSE